jgi:hypothetical protein
MVVPSEMPIVRVAPVTGLQCPMRAERKRTGGASGIDEAE